MAAPPLSNKPTKTPRSNTASGVINTGSSTTSSKKLSTSTSSSTSTGTTRSSTTNNKKKKPRKTRYSLPAKASESQHTLTQIRFIPRIHFGGGGAGGEEEAVDLEYIDPAANSSPPREREEITSKRKKSVTGSGLGGLGSGIGKVGKKKRLANAPDDRTLTQMKYVERVDNTGDEDMDVDMEMGCIDLEEQDGEDLIGSGVRSSPLYRARRNRADRVADAGDVQDESDVPLRKGLVRLKYTPEAWKRKSREMTPENTSKTGSKRKSTYYRDASGDAESDYADDESPKPKKRKRKNTVTNSISNSTSTSNSQGPIASRLRPRKTRVSYSAARQVAQQPTPVQERRKKTRKVAEPEPEPGPRLETPVKRQRFEIPSSQSPFSTPLSIRSRPSSQHVASPVRSPLLALSDQSRLANFNPVPRSRDDDKSKDKTFGTTREGNVSKENLAGSQESKGSANTTLPDLAELLGIPTKPQGQMHDVPDPAATAVPSTNDRRNGHDEDYEMGLETQSVFNDLGPSSLEAGDDLASIQASSQASPLRSQKHAVTETIRPLLSRSTSTAIARESPPWLGENSLETMTMRTTELTTALHQSQISTQGFPLSSTKSLPQSHNLDGSSPSTGHVSSSAPPPTQQTPTQKDLTQIWDSSPSPRTHRRPSPSLSFPNKTSPIPDQNRTVSLSPQNSSSQQQHPKDLTQVWESSDYNTPTPSADGSVSNNEVEGTISMDHGEMVKRDGREEIFQLPSSHLLPSSMMASLPKPPQWSQGSFSDEDWV